VIERLPFHCHEKSDRIGGNWVVGNWVVGNVNGMSVCSRGLHMRVRQRTRQRTRQGHRKRHRRPTGDRDCAGVSDR
jgi:ribosomal protein L21